jgi:type IV fimbrial biogenesis protein FimT
MNKIVGFTIIELMITLLIAAILAGAGIPALSDFISERSLAADITRFNGALALARSESITRGKNVVVCPSADGESCESKTEWAAGWIVFRDVNSDNTVSLGTKACGATEDCILRYDQGMKSATKVTAGANYLGFNGRGERISGSSTSIKICSPKARTVSTLTVASSGSVSIVKKEEVCS